MHIMCIVMMHIIMRMCFVMHIIDMMQIDTYSCYCYDAIIMVNIDVKHTNVMMHICNML